MSKEVMQNENKKKARVTKFPTAAIRKVFKERGEEEAALRNKGSPRALRVNAAVFPLIDEALAKKVRELYDKAARVVRLANRSTMYPKDVRLCLDLAEGEESFN
jgi:histone H3/H4